MSTAVVVVVCVAAVGVWRAGPAVLPFMAATGLWALLAGIGSTAARDLPSVLTGPVVCLAGPVAPVLIAWVSGIGSPRAVGEASMFAAVFGMAMASHPTVATRVRPRGGRQLRVVALNGGPVSHLAVIPHNDPLSLRLLAVAASPWTPGSPALCGQDLPDGDAGVCMNCAVQAVRIADGNIAVGDTVVGWDTPDIGLIVVLAHLAN